MDKQERLVTKLSLMDVTMSVVTPVVGITMGQSYYEICLDGTNKEGIRINVVVGSKDPIIWRNKLVIGEYQYQELRREIVKERD